MIDKALLGLLGKNKRYIYFTVGLMLLGLFANVGITAGICRVIYIAVNFNLYARDATLFILPSVLIAVCITVRYISSRFVGYFKDLLGREAKTELREKLYAKIVRLGVRATDGMSMA